MRRLSRGGLVTLLIAIPAIAVPLVLLSGSVMPANAPMGAMPGMPAAAGGDAPAGRIAVPGGSYAEIDPAVLAERLSRKDFLLIDVHIPYEGEIAGTDRSIPFDRIGDASAQLPADRGAEIILYCRTGRMSAEAATTLVRLGYRNVSHLAGGLEAWRARGLPVVTRP